VVAIANLVPTFGPIIGGAAGALILLLVNPKYILWFLIFTVILQTIDGYILKPHLYGDTLGVSPLWILVCIILGGRIFGITGVVLAIPFAAISDYVFYEQVWKKVEAKDRNYSGEEKTANGTSWESRGAKTKKRNKKQ
jgi:predicted PurR-regulated permease PerM